MAMKAHHGAAITRVTLTIFNIGFILVCELLAALPFILFYKTFGFLDALKVKGKEIGDVGREVAVYAPGAWAGYQVRGVAFLMDGLKGIDGEEAASHPEVVPGYELGS
jgi:hypothetical protein